MQEFKLFRALGLAFRAWFRNFVPFTLLMAAVYAPVILWLTTVNPGTAATDDEFVSMAFSRPLYALMALTTLVAPLITYRVVQDLNGIKVSMLTSMKYGVRGILPGVFLAVILNLVGLIPGVGGIASAIITCILFVATPAAVAEKLGPFDAFQRSAELTRGRRWGIFGLSFLVGLVLVALLFALVFPLLLKENSGALLANWKSTAIEVTIVVGVCYMFTGIVAAVSYALLREDKDGVHHDALAKIFD
jgi:hypothetical protein